jgi:hypothetical protein
MWSRLSEAILLAGRRDVAVRMMAGQLPQRLIEFIHECVPTYQAAEVLLFFAAHPDGEYSAEDIVVAMRPVVITVPAVKEYASLFVDKGLIQQAHERYRYGPSTTELEHGIDQLAKAYNEKPVTLIRAIYGIADSKIQSFADAFKLRED